MHLRFMLTIYLGAIVAIASKNKAALRNDFADLRRMNIPSYIPPAQGTNDKKTTWVQTRTYKDDKYNGEERGSMSEIFSRFRTQLQRIYTKVLEWLKWLKAKLFRQSTELTETKMPKIPPTITLSQEVKSTDPDPVKLVPLVVGKDKKLIMEKLPDYLAYCATSASNRKGWDMYGVEELLRQKAITEEKLVEYLLSKTGSKNPVDAFVVEYLQAGLYAMYRRDGKKYDVILRSSQAVRNWINAAPNKQRRKIFTPIPDTKTSGRPLKAFQNSMVTKDNKFDWELLPSYVISNEKSRMLSLHDRWGVMKLFELNAKGFSEVKLIEYFLKDLKSDDLFRRSIAERLEDGLLEIYERYGKNEKAIKNATKAVKRWWYNAPPLPK